VLIGTRLVETSELISGLSHNAGLAHVVLNARQDREEAELAAAGQPGRVTVATNTAGRGTDIRLSHVVREAGGLHVILTEYHESKRIDSQLFGRGGRQGDAGGFECLASLDDEIIARFGGPVPSGLARSLSGEPRPRVPAWLTGPLLLTTQDAAGRLNARIRSETLASDLRLNQVLAFAGQRE